MARIHTIGLGARHHDRGTYHQGSNTVRFLIFSAAIVLPTATVIIATKGRLGRAKEAVDIHAGVSDANL
jgi:hypothetical protein